MLLIYFIRNQQSSQTVVLLQSVRNASSDVISRHVKNGVLEMKLDIFGVLRICLRSVCEPKLTLKLDGMLHGIVYPVGAGYCNFLRRIYWIFQLEQTYAEEREHISR